jgi:hypothetical protein
VIEKIICQRAYEISTLYHDHRELVETKPRPLGEHVGYRLYWQEFLQGQRQLAPTIEVCALGKSRLSKVVIAVTASNDMVCFQNEVVMRHVDTRRHRAPLSSIPFRRPRIDGGLVYTPYDEFHIELIEALDERGGCITPRWSTKDVIHPMDRLEVALGQERDFVEKWGRTYNLSFLEMEIREEAVRMFAWSCRRSHVLRLLLRPLQSRNMAKAIFWSRNALRAAPLERAFIRHIEEYRDYLARQADRSLPPLAETVAETNMS